MEADFYRKAFLGFGGAATGASLAVAVASVAGFVAPPLVPIVGAMLFSALALATDRRKTAPPSIDAD